MDRIEAEKLLRGGPEGIKEWNRRRDEGEKIPSLKKIDLSKAHLCEANLSGANLRDADLHGAHLYQADLRDANLRDANLHQADLRKADLDQADLRGATLRGAYLSGACFNGADLSGATLSRANLSGANLSGARLSGARLWGADLSGANLSGADLCGANLSGANLRVAILSKANLREANLYEANLRGADLRGADLSKANLRDADLRKADLRKADLSEANLTRADLSGADLSGANLTMSHLVACNLSNAIVDDCLVERTNIKELRGLPKPPGTLRLSVKDDDVLTGETAAEFFKMSAIVEVFMSERLPEEAIAMYHFHLGEMRQCKVGTSVFLIGARHECTGTVMRFQGPDYDSIYAILPDLLAPFRQSHAIDWKETLNNIPDDKRADAIKHLAKQEISIQNGKWILAEKMADFLRVFADARISLIKEGDRSELRIEVVTDPSMSEQLASSTMDPSKMLIIQIPEGNNNFQIDIVNKKEVNMIENYINNGQAGAMGKNVDVHDNTINQIWNELAPKIDMEELTKELAELRQAMKLVAETPEQDAAIGEIAKAQTAAVENKGSKVLQHLKNAGKFAWDSAKEVGTDIIVKLIEKQMD